MSISAKLTFSQIGIFIAILSYLVIRGAFVVINIGFLWTTPGGYLSIALPLLPVIILGFTACVIAYAYSYLGLWMMDRGLYIPGAIVIILAVIVAPGALGAYGWVAFPPN